MLENMLELVTTLNDTLPQFSSYLEMFPECSALQFHLQDLYYEYMDYCITSIHYLQRSGTGKFVLVILAFTLMEIEANFLIYFFSSSPQQKLKRTRENIQKHVKLFRRAAQLAFREKEMEQHQKINSTLTTQPLAEVPQDVPDMKDPNLEFPISTVTLYRNYTFLGREDVLQDLEKTLLSSTTDSNNQNGQPSAVSKHGKNPACVVLQGLGGIGKSQIALEFTYAHRDSFDAIFWVRSDQDSTLAATFSSIAQTLNMTEDIGGHDGQNQGRAIERANKWLKTTSKLCMQS